MLTVAVIQLDNNDKAQEIFERINSTGIPLSLADKIRNYILMTEVEFTRIKIENKLDIDELAQWWWLICGTQKYVEKNLNLGLDLFVDCHIFQHTI